MTDTATIVVKSREIAHNDPGEAGFTDGYWWKVTDRLGTFESGSPTRDEAVGHATQVARSHGYTDDQITIKD